MTECWVILISDSFLTQIHTAYLFVCPCPYKREPRTVFEWFILALVLGSKIIADK